LVFAEQPQLAAERFIPHCSHSKLPLISPVKAQLNGDIAWPDAGRWCRGPASTDDDGSWMIDA
jgi:hypothetical protein